MLVCKYIILFLIFGTSSKIGILISKKYKDRVEILQEFKTLLNSLKTKIKFTYEPLPEILKEIANDFKDTNKKVYKIFEKASTYMKESTASEAWNRALDESKIFTNEEDRKIIKNLGNMLGKIDLDGQVNDIYLTVSFLDEQIEVAKKDLIKNEKLYKNLGNIIGAGIVVILF